MPEYDETITDHLSFRESLDHKINVFPELFPAYTASGYKLKNLRDSKKVGISIRRIEVGGIDYTIRPYS